MPADRNRPEKRSIPTKRLTVASVRILHMKGLTTFKLEKVQFRSSKAGACVVDASAAMGRSDGGSEAPSNNAAGSRSSGAAGANARAQAKLSSAARQHPLPRIAARPSRRLGGTACE